jgi:hypothetical protein
VISEVVVKTLEAFTLITGTNVSIDIILSSNTCPFGQVFCLIETGYKVHLTL